MEDSRDIFSTARRRARLNHVDRSLHPRTGFWAAIAGARALAWSLNGVIEDPAIPRLHARTKNDQPLPADGRPRMLDEILIFRSTGSRGSVWITTKGLLKFGLPELEIRNAPANRSENLSLLLAGLAQRLTEEAREQAGRWEGEPRDIEVPAEISIRLPDILRAGGEIDSVAVPEGTPGLGTVSLQYRPGRRGGDSFMTVVRPASFRGRHEAWLDDLCRGFFGPGGSPAPSGTDLP